MKLGIACVYFFRDEDAWILDLQLDFIEKTTKGTDFTVYAAAARLQPRLRDRLAARSFVRIVDLPPCPHTGGPEHGHYLEVLLHAAKADGCTHLCTLDCDSFPVADNWPHSLAERLSGAERLAAVFRAENRDTDLPHPCGIFMEAGLLDELVFEFYPSEGLQQSDDFKRYVAATGQRIDTGTGLGFALWRAGEPWARLLRSNAWNPHFLMAGLYADVFFHLGASSRAPGFHLDYATMPGLRLSLLLKDVPLLWRVGHWFESRYLKENRGIAAAIREQLTDDPEHFIARLRGGT